ncbi:MAG: mandelate racemase/muconate lactonizing enzyme family protein [Cytophagaceae bacterium]|nr:mandelate racemase/muconate lactonizing enzyme family protein [Cytophagaceae bacterium]
MNRTQFLKTLGGAAALAAIVAPLGARPVGYRQAEPFPAWPFPDLTKRLPDPLLIRSVELLRTQGEFLLVVTGQNGERGIAQCNDRMPHLTSLLRGLVLPHFVGKDARDLRQLTDNAYRLNSNYKYAGMPLWNCIGSVEIACWDLIGQTARQPVCQLLGESLRRDYPVYVSDFDRASDPALVFEQMQKKLAVTGATGVKIKVGGRMRNTPDDDARTRRLVPLARKMFGDAITIYADANGSYTAKEGVEIGRLLEDHGVAIFEEPCNFEDEDGLRIVNQALTKLKLAGGEQDTSLYKFQRLAQTGVYDVLQPDLFYNGGLARALQVAKIAEAQGKTIAPHTPKADPLIAPFWHFAAVVPNLYGLQEFVLDPGEATGTWFTPAIRVQNGRMTIPQTPGLGIAYDESIWKSAEKIV